MNEVLFDNFIKTKISDDIKNGVVDSDNIVLRFPPEPNGHLHLGHAKSIILHKHLSKEFKAKLRLRFDDTNPDKESSDYVNAIKEDFFWLLGQE